MTQQQDLEVRLARLETQNRRMKRVGAAALGGLGFLTLVGFAAPSLCEVVWAERFVLRDASNRTRIQINAYGTDTPSIAFHDKKGKEVGSIGLASDGSFELRVREDGRSVKAAFELGDDGELRLAKAEAPAPERKAGLVADKKGD